MNTNDNVFIIFNNFKVYSRRYGALIRALMHINSISKPWLHLTAFDSARALNPVMIPRIMNQMCIKMCPTETFLITLPPSGWQADNLRFALMRQVTRSDFNRRNCSNVFSKRPDHPALSSFHYFSLACPYLIRNAGFTDLSTLPESGP